MIKLWTPELASGGQLYPCAKCGLEPSPEGHDGCLGTLPDHNIMNACCGHGNDAHAYIQYWDRSRIAGDEAINEQRRLLTCRDISTAQCLAQKRPVTLKHEWDFARFYYHWDAFKSELKLAFKPITDWLRRLLNT